MNSFEIKKTEKFRRILHLQKGENIKIFLSVILKRLLQLDNYRINRKISDTNFERFATFLEPLIFLKLYF